MPKGKPKISPIRSRIVFVSGPALVFVEPEDFVELIAGKDLKIIQKIDGPYGWPRKYTDYTYVAPDTPITFFTKTREELTELHIEIIAENIMRSRRIRL